MISLMKLPVAIRQEGKVLKVLIYVEYSFQMYLQNGQDSIHGDLFIFSMAGLNPFSNAERSELFTQLLATN